MLPSLSVQLSIVENEKKSTRLGIISPHSTEGVGREELMAIFLARGSREARDGGSSCLTMRSYFTIFTDEESTGALLAMRNLVLKLSFFHSALMIQGWMEGFNGAISTI